VNRGQASAVANEKGWDIQKIDMGITLAHFACGLEEIEKDASLYLEQNVASFKF